MSIAPLSLITKQLQSPDKVAKHHDSLIFSITSQKLNQRKETLLLDESKQLKKSKQEFISRDYFKIQDKIKILEQKVENIKTQYCQSNRKFNQSQNFRLSFNQSDKQNIKQIINLEFPQQIYDKSFSMNDNNLNRSSIGKIKHKKSKYFTGTQNQKNKIRSKSRSQSRQKTQNQFSVISTKRNNRNTTNISNDQSKRKSRNNSFERKKGSKYDVIDMESFSFLKGSSKGKGEMERKSKRMQSKEQYLRRQLIKSKLSEEKLSRKSRESERRVSQSKGQIKRLENEMTKHRNELEEVRRRLRKSQRIRQRQKETMMQQKVEIEHLKSVIQEIVRANNVDLKKLKVLR